MSDFDFRLIPFFFRVMQNSEIFFGIYKDGVTISRCVLCQSCVLKPALCIIRIPCFHVQGLSVSIDQKSNKVHLHLS